MPTNSRNAKKKKISTKGLPHSEVVNQVYENIKDDTITKTQVKKTMHALAEVAKEQLAERKDFKLKNVCKLSVKHRKAQPARKIYSFGREVKVKAKPESTVVKAYPDPAWKRMKI